jgi:hypothetical protein
MADLYYRFSLEPLAGALGLSIRSESINRSRPNEFDYTLALLSSLSISS